jgi:hypothetical protein
VLKSESEKRRDRVVSAQITALDFRRSAVRNLINAGVNQATAMKIREHRAASRGHGEGFKQLKNDAKRSTQFP